MKTFDFVCQAGHKYEEIYRSDETIPDAIPCEKCVAEGKPDAQMERVKLYPTAGFMLPSGTGTYSQGF